MHQSEGTFLVEGLNANHNILVKNASSSSGEWKRVVRPETGCATRTTSESLNLGAHGRTARVVANADLGRDRVGDSADV
jgi:hypothetical protein